MTHAVFEQYDRLKYHKIKSRYLGFENIECDITAFGKFFSIKTEGYSENSRPIYSMRLGTGKKKVLIWSQMHGNESTTTKACFDLLNACRDQFGLKVLEEIMGSCTILLLPVLNPDGATAYTRKNANQTDLNRDASDLSQKESRVLNKVFHAFSPDFCFNLHDQRTLFSVGNCSRPATVSFLAPSYNEKKDVNASRQKAMQLILRMNECLQKFIPGQIGRYDDTYNPNCVGDKFQSMKTPTILFEAGHFSDDYDREITRKFIFFALIQGLFSISTHDFIGLNHKSYYEIPENQKKFYDIILRNVSFKDKEYKDIGIQYEERLKGNHIHFIPILQKIGDLDSFFGHKEIDVEGQKIKINENLSFDENCEIQSLGIGNKNLLLNLK